MGGKDFEKREATCAHAFIDWLKPTNCHQIIYLSGLVPDEEILSTHLIGGIGMRRGRRGPTDLKPGDALDFWRVILADKEAGRLMLFAEMKLPGEAWLEFSVEDGKLKQCATFRPRGLFGRLYWFVVYPFHLILFPRMARILADAWKDRTK